jgi:DNA-binding transcriptional regulator YiaG
MTTVGPLKVRDKTVALPQCDRCDVVDVPMDIAAGLERRAARTVLLDAPKADGATVRFARKALGLRQADLGRLLGVNDQAVSRWENGHENVTRTTQLAIAHLLVIAETHGMQAIRELLEYEPEEPPPSLLEVRSA